MSAFVAFWIGCLVGTVVGVMFLALMIVARDAEERANRISGERMKNDD